MKDDKHVCPLCDYIYDELKGDVARNIPAGTKFSELPADFKHSDCEATKQMMESCTCATLASNN